MKPARVLLLNLSEFIGYVDLTDFREISRNPSRGDDKRNCREILIFKVFFPWGPFTQHVSHTFSYSNLRCGYRDNQSEYGKSLTHFG